MIVVHDKIDNNMQQKSAAKMLQKVLCPPAISAPAWKHTSPHTLAALKFSSLRELWSRVPCRLSALAVSCPNFMQKIRLSLDPKKLQAPETYTRFAREREDSSYCKKSPPNHFSPNLFQSQKQNFNLHPGAQIQKNTPKKKEKQMQKYPTFP